MKNLLSYFKTKKRTLDTGAIDLSSYGGLLSLSAPEISSPTLSLKVATVFRCISILSGSIASLPLEVQRKKDGYFQEDLDSDLGYLLSVSPNDRMTPFEFMRNLIIQVLGKGNAYVYYGLQDGHYTSLVLLTPGCCYYNDYTDEYQVSDLHNHIYGTYSSDEIIHIKGLTCDGSGYRGESVLRYAARTIGLATREEEESAEVLQKGSTYKGFISGDDDGIKGFGKPQDTQLETVRTRVEKEMKEGKNIMYLPGNMKFSQMSMSPADLQLLDSKKFTVLDICRFYGVHPDMVFQNQSNNYKASDAAQTIFLVNTMRPYLIQIQQEFRRKLIPRSMAKKMRLKFDLEEYYELDFSTKSAFMKTTIECGVRTPNEWRSKDGKAPLSGGEKAFISCNVAPIDSAKIKGENTVKSPNNSQKDTNTEPKPTNSDNSVD